MPTLSGITGKTEDYKKCLPIGQHVLSQYNKIQQKPLLLLRKNWKIETRLLSTWSSSKNSGEITQRESSLHFALAVTEEKLDNKKLLFFLQLLVQITTSKRALLRLWCHYPFHREYDNPY